MISRINELIDVSTSTNLTYQQKLFNLANTAERLISPVETLGYTPEEMEYIENDMVCDLNEGYLPYRPRYIVPDYNVFVEKGCEFLELEKPTDLDELIDGLLILYSHIPSITSFPVFVGSLDALIEPFITDEEKDYKKIKRFLNHIDKTVPDSFCHADIGPHDTKAGRLILRAVEELGNPTPNMTLNYQESVTSDEFAKLALRTSLLSSKPSFSNYTQYLTDMGDHSIVSCYNALPNGGGAYTLLRLRLGTIARASSSLDAFLSELLPGAARAMAGMIDKRIRFIVEKSGFFESSFLVKEGFVDKNNFTAMFGIVGLADAVNHFLDIEGITERFGQAERGNEIAIKILEAVREVSEGHEGIYCERTKDRYPLHAQVGASLSEEDKLNTPAHRIRVGEEPALFQHLNSSMPLHAYFPTGTGDLFSFDRTWLDKTDALLDIVKGAFANGGRYITCYLNDTDLVRVTGYLVKKSSVQKFRKGEAVLRDTDIFGDGTDANAHVFERRVR